MFSGGVKSDTQPSTKGKTSSNKTQFHNKCKIVVLSIVLSLLLNQVPVTATVTDNLSSTIYRLLGIQNDTVKDSYETASINAKLNYLESQVSSITGTEPKTGLYAMNMKEIQAACKSGTIRNVANVGDTFSDGRFTYTIIGIDQDTPSDENGNPLDKSKYGNVLTVMALGAQEGPRYGSAAVKCNIENTPYGTKTESYNNVNLSKSWSGSDIRTSALQIYMGALPESTRNVIGYVKKVTGILNSSSTEVTGDKLFLLSATELFGSDLGQVAVNAEEILENKQYSYFSDVAKTATQRNIIGDVAQSPGRYIRLRSQLAGNGAACLDQAGNIVHLGLLDSFYVVPAFCIY